MKERGVCGRYIQDVVCTKCSPFSAHIFDAEGNTPARNIPGICPSLCSKIYAFNCTAIVLELFGIQKRVFSDAEDFCNEFSISDADYCYPRVLEQSTNIKSGSKTPVGGSFDREDCVCVKEIASGLKNPIALVHANDLTHRMFVAEQLGIVHVILRNGTMLPQPFLDISSLVLLSSYPGDERGFLGIAFHPHFNRNGRVFTYYAAKVSPARFDVHNKRTNHVNRLSQFTLSPSNLNKLDESTEEIILEISQPKSNHNGGSLFFDLDNYLYLSLGDGGGAGDNFGTIGNAQNKSNIHGTLIRIDVDDASTRRQGQNYGIPAWNPFTTSDYASEKHEIFAYGLRNIWRCSIDQGDMGTGEGQGRIFCGDVGQGRYEEVDIVDKGKNYGWRIMEGNVCYRGCPSTVSPLEPPIIAYPHSEGKSVIGGYVYRGCLFPRFRGKYIFGDYTSGSLFYGIENSATGHWSKESICLAADSSCKGGGVTNSYKSGILSFGESESGEIYFLSTSNPSSSAPEGSLYQLLDPTAREECTVSETPPTTPYSTNWNYTSVCEGCGPRDVTSTNICSVISDFVLEVEFMGRIRDSLTSHVHWIVTVKNIVLLRRDGFWYLRIGDVIHLKESEDSTFCRCLSSEVINPSTEQARSGTYYLVSGLVERGILLLDRGSLLIESSQERHKIFEDYLSSCFE